MSEEANKWEQVMQDEAEKDSIDDSQGVASDELSEEALQERNQKDDVELSLDNDDILVNDSAGLNPVVLQKKLEDAQKRLMELEKNEKYMAAEMQTLRTRNRAQVEKAEKFAVSGLLKELLQVIDSLDHGLQVDKPESSEALALYEGMRLTADLLLKVLTSFGVEILFPEKGDAFDPEKHNAVSAVAQEDMKGNTVFDVLQKGYGLNGRVIRPAMVVVVR